jgi:hypothetical protein
MFPNLKNPFTITKIINGLSKSLNVANNIIPIYEQTKPMIENARNIIKKIKNIDLNKIKNNINNIHDTKIKTTTLKSNSLNNPSFFK